MRLRFAFERSDWSAIFVTMRPCSVGPLLDRPSRQGSLPGVSALFGDPERARRRSKGEPVPGFINVESVTEDQVLRMLLRETRR
jgi:hypothetical protein